VGRGSLWSWLGGVVRNQVGNYFRNKSRAGRLQQGGDLHPAVSGTLAERLRQGTPSPQGGPIAAEEAAIVRATLAGLPEDYQSLLAARYFEGVSIEEMARIGNCTASAVRSKLARARRGFREAYMRVLAFEGDGSGNTP
jgi:RNA polymerase sigma-70 factor (ECF subfamily)